jgi:hypothetical protein
MFAFQPPTIGWHMDEGLPRVDLSQPIVGTRMAGIGAERALSLCG